MATLTVVTPTRSGVVFALASAAGGGDEFDNTGKEVLVINNGDASSMTLTVVTQSTLDGEAVADKTYTIGASEQQVVGPFPTAWYNDGNDRVQLTYSSVTSLTVGVLKTVAEQ